MTETVKIGNYQAGEDVNQQKQPSSLARLQNHIHFGKQCNSEF
jgi:hypothetical protein